MCGICCIYGHQDHVCADYIESQNRLSRRGPDISDKTQVTVHENKILSMFGHVLHLRGKLTPQPLSDAEGNVLLWNGEIFGGIEVKEEENDTEILLNLLSGSSDASHIIDTMSQIQGPWAFIYWQEKTKHLWFGRDIFGRRSLLWRLPDSKNSNFILTSTRMSDTDEYLEVPSVGLFCVTFPGSCVTDDCKLNIHLYPWYRAVWPGTMDKVDVNTLNDRLYPGHSNSSVTFSLDSEQQVPSQIPILNKEIPSGGSIDRSKEKIDSQKFIQDLIKEDVNLNILSNQLIHVLQMAVCKRVYNQPYLHQGDRMRKKHKTVLKSGNEETNKPEVVVDVQCHQNPFNQNSDENQPSDHISGSYCRNSMTVGNQNCGTSDALSENAGNKAYVVLEDKFFACTVTEQKSVVRNITVGCNEDARMASLSGSEVNNESSAKVAILFSGGIDSAVITALVDRCLPIEEPVDLINVAFEQNHAKRDSSSSEQQRWNVPDRQTGFTALSELNPNRKWNFILVNVTLEQLKKVRSEHVRHLVYPLDTVLDDSIGCAVWFAARGEGILGNGDHIGQPYTSKAKVILCGMGADEQFAGYSRHRGKYQESGFQGLIDEIELEVSRISARNLGRDDRIITDHGKESRFPFLDENVVSFLSQLPIHHKANLDLPRGLGEKLLLRMSATKLGLVNTAVFPKRAIQFGSRIAKIENSKEKATDKCSRLTES